MSKLEVELKLQIIDESRWNDLVDYFSFFMHGLLSLFQKEEFCRCDDDKANYK